MKQLILIFALFAPFTAFAEPGDCTKLAAFKQNQEQKLNLERYGLGLIDVRAYDALNADAKAKYLLAVAACGKATK